MKNKVTINIGGSSYTICADEPSDYIEKIAEYVDSKLNDFSSASFSSYDKAILASINIADEYFKSKYSAENLRSQLRDYVDDASKLKSQLNETKRELEKLRLENEKLKKHQ